MESFGKDIIANISFAREFHKRNNDKCKYIICDVNILYCSIEIAINYDYS